MNIDADKSDFEAMLELVVDRVSDLDTEYKSFLSRSIDSLQQTEETLMDKISELEGTIHEKDNTIDSLEEDKNNLEIEISEANSTIFTLEAEVAEYAAAQPPI